MVRDLADALPSPDGQEPEPASTDEVLNGSQARGSLTQWIQLEALHAELERRGETPTPDERTQAKEQVDSLDGLSKDTSTRLTSLLASAIAMDRIIGSEAGPAPEVPEPTDEEIAAKAAELLATIPPDQLTLACSNAIAGPAAAADQVQALLDGGTDINDPAAFTALEYAPPSTTNPLCVSPSQLPPELQEPYTSAPEGELARADFSSAGDGTLDQTLFFVPTGPRTLTAEDPDVVAAARQELEQAAQEEAAAAQQASQSELAEAYRKIFRSSDIEVDPRFGTFDPEGTVEPPIAPLVPATDGPVPFELDPATAI
jgi:hypothetical protein